ncbi:hypothetical protein DY78_GL001136 [Lactiplantibacillus fabifermentans DSM 21115]|uniref:Uncharacterized protein n=1 Tax=Lactiplantibacillus fabifermentans DSM 21115 TaxID=1413187 RepID=A0A0R2NIR5_9LACO|nr:hypothetical protein DY78_GL001136 [Lactiplantibacillus fabifermentans DSM 21115]
MLVIASLWAPSPVSWLVVDKYVKRGYVLAIKILKRINDSCDFVVAANYHPYAKYM